MFLHESPLSMDLWLRTFGLSSLVSIDIQNASEDVLVPPFDAESRQGSAVVSKAVLILTLVGNGCLGVPYAFAKCGVPLAIFLIIALAILMDLTLYLLWICARKTGCNTYGGVVRVTFGDRAHGASSLFIFLYLLLMVSQYMISVRDIFSKLIQHYLPEASPFLIMFWLQILLVPAFYKTKLRSLWFFAYIGVFSLIASFAILCYKSNHYHTEIRVLRTWPVTFNDTLLGFNTLLLNIVASFNILYVQSELKTPTLPRMETVVRQGVFAASLLAVAIGVAGCRFFYLADDEIPYNFLDHAALQYHSQALHLASGITIWLATPLIVIPCRDNFLDMIEALCLDGKCPEEFSDCQDDIETFTTRSSTLSGQNHNTLVLYDETSHLLPSIEEDTRCELNLNPYAHYGSIFVIMVAAELLTLDNTIVPIIWKILAPSMTVIVAYLLPAACYLEIHKRQCQRYKTFSRWVIALSITFCFFCTIEAVRDVLVNR